jgi:hypothetical protein
MAVQMAALPEFAPPLEPVHPIARILRTPEAAFASLSDFPFAPKYFETHSHGPVTKR